MRIWCALGTVVMLVSSTRVASAEDMIIAPFPIEDSTGRFDRAALSALEQYLAGRLAAYPSISLIPGSDVKSKIEEQKNETFKECYDQSCQVELGKELAATHIVTPRLSAVGTQCIFSAFLYDLRTATTRSASTVRTACDEDALVAVLDRVVAELVGEAPGAVRLEPKLQPPLDPEGEGTGGRPPPPPSIAPKDKPEVTVAATEKSSLAGTLWLSAAGVLVGGGILVDVVPSSSTNGELDAVDFVPVGLYALGATAAVVGLISLLDD